MVMTKLAVVVALAALAALTVGDDPAGAATCRFQTVGKTMTMTRCWKAPWLPVWGMRDTLERNGIPTVGGWRNVDRASCYGLLRYGRQEAVSGGFTYHAFRCNVDGADGHRYTVRVLPLSIVTTRIS